MLKQRLFQRLAEPLDPARIKTVRRGDTLLRTVDARTVIERLNRACPGGWSFEVEPVSGPQTGVDGPWIVRGRLTIAGAVQEDFGIGERGSIDPPKAAVSDALKRCAVHFGVGLELYGEGLALIPGPSPLTGRRETEPASRRTRRSVGQYSSSPLQPHEVGSGRGGQGARDRPLPPGPLREAIAALVIAQPEALRDVQPGPADIRRLIIRVKRLGLTDDQRHALAERLFGVSSFKGLTAAQAGALWEWSTDVAAARVEALELIKEAA